MTVIAHDSNAAPAATQACPCGSGLSHARCCALDLRTLSADPDPAQARKLAFMAQARHAGDPDAVRRTAIEVLEAAPGEREALIALFQLLRDEEPNEAAVAIVDRLARVHQNDAAMRLTAAQYLIGRSDLARAQYHARMLVRLAPEAAIAHFTMGRAFLAQNAAKAAEHHFRIALDLPASTSPPLPRAEIELHLAMALRDSGAFDEARAIFARVANDGNLSVLLAWANLEESAQRFDAARDVLDRAEALAPGHLRVATARASLLRRTKQPEQALDLIAAADDGEGETLLQKGQILDSIGRYDEAFAAFDAYKQRLRARSGKAYGAEQAESLVRELRDFFTAGRSRLLPRAARRPDSPQPIFIVGFPRSGTTLVEQTLTSHPDIAAGDELPIINRLAERLPQLLGSMLPYPRALSELWLGDRAGHIDMLRDYYLAEAARIGVADPARPWFTDKMPLNETHLGLIHLIFPESPIIHLVRHPLDVVLSVFSNGLTHGFHCAYALDTAAQHYALIAELIRHYREALPLNYHAVRYEELVTEQEAQVRAMLDFVGVAFDPRVLDFHRNERPARTASYAQVTEQLYTSSRYRHRNYRRHLAPVVPILAPAIARLGYPDPD